MIGISMVSMIGTDYPYLPSFAFCLVLILKRGMVQGTWNLRLVYHPLSFYVQFPMFHFYTSYLCDFLDYMLYF